MKLLEGGNIWGLPQMFLEMLLSFPPFSLDFSPSSWSSSVGHCCTANKTLSKILH